VDHEEGQGVGHSLGRPYDLALINFPRLQKERWNSHVHEQLIDRWGEDAIYMVLAGADYRAAVWQMPYVEDVLAHWTQHRIDSGMTGRRASMSIGIIKRYLKEDKAYGC
jgi:hypothetical protein